jgi:hypothetical protein
MKKNETTETTVDGNIKELRAPVDGNIKELRARLVALTNAYYRATDEDAKVACLADAKRVKAEIDRQRTERANRRAFDKLLA